MNQPLEKYSHHTRMRVCGLLVENDRLLLLKHGSLGDAGFVWIPPGGGIKYGSDLKQNLVREFIEETGLKVEVGKLICVHEFMTTSLHAIELFFRVRRISGELRLGTDPEVGEEDQILEELRFMDFSEINRLPASQKHQILIGCHSSRQLLELRGYYQTRT